MPTNAPPRSWPSATRSCSASVFTAHLLFVTAAESKNKSRLEVRVREARMQIVANRPPAPKEEEKEAARQRALEKTARMHARMKVCENLPKPKLGSKHLNSDPDPSPGR